MSLLDVRIREFPKRRFFCRCECLIYRVLQLFLKKDVKIEYAIPQKIVYFDNINLTTKNMIGKAV